MTMPDVCATPAALDFQEREILAMKERTGGLYCAELDKLAHDVIKSSVECMRGDRRARNRVFGILLTAYIAVFLVGLVAFAAALYEGLMQNSDPTTTAVFAGMSGASFVSLALFKPLETVRRNSIFLTWLNVTTTSYWTRHYYLNKKGLLDHELELATLETLAHLKQLVGELPELPADAEATPEPEPEPVLR